MADQLPAIQEDGDGAPAPPIPFKAQHRQNRHRFSWAPPKHSFEKSPPAYASLEKVDHLRTIPQIAKRGGWKRLCLIGSVVVLCLVGLIVGLVVGLRKKS